MADHPLPPPARTTPGDSIAPACIRSSLRPEASSSPAAAFWKPPAWRESGHDRRAQHREYAFLRQRRQRRRHQSERRRSGRHSKQRGRGDDDQLGNCRQSLNRCSHLVHQSGSRNRVPHQWEQQLHRQQQLRQQCLRREHRLHVYLRRLRLEWQPDPRRSGNSVRPHARPAGPYLFGLLDAVQRHTGQPLRRRHRHDRRHSAIRPRPATP